MNLTVNGAEIARRRKSYDITQPELACLVGIQKGSMWRIEKEKRGVSIKTLGKIANVLHCEPADLLAEKGAI